MYPRDLPQSAPELPHKSSWITITSLLKRTAWFILGLTQFMVLFGFLGMGPANHYAYGLGNATGFTCIVLYLLSNTLGIWWHELGHYLAARSVGEQLLLFCARPLAVYPDVKRWRVSYFSHKHFGGLVSTIPTWPVPDDFRRRRLIILLAGPLSSLLMAVIAFGLERSLGWHDDAAATLSHAQQFVGLSLWIIIYIGLWDSIANLTPFNVANTGTDGMQALQLLFRTKRWRMTEAYDRFLAMQCSTLPPAEWDRDLISWLIEHHDDESVRTYALAADYMLMQERESPEAARPYLERCLTQLPVNNPVLAAQICLSAAFHYAAYDEDVAKARAWLDLADEAPDNEGVKAVILHLEGDTEQALTLLDEAIAKENSKIGTRFDVGAVRQYRTWLLRFREQITGESATDVPIEETPPKKSPTGKRKLVLLGALLATILGGVLLAPHLGSPPAVSAQEVPCPENASDNWDEFSVSTCYSVAFSNNKRFRAWTKAETKALDLALWETRENAVVYQLRDSQRVQGYYYDFEDELVYLLDLEQQLEH